LWFLFLASQQQGESIKHFPPVGLNSRFSPCSVEPTLALASQTGEFASILYNTVTPMMIMYSLRYRDMKMAMKSFLHSLLFSWWHWLWPCVWTSLTKDSGTENLIIWSLKFLWLDSNTNACLTMFTGVCKYNYLKRLLISTVQFISFFLLFSLWRH
jgi:hypothetical protein